MPTEVTITDNPCSAVSVGGPSVADHSKLGPDYFARFGELNEIDTLLTDTDADDGLIAELESAGLRVVQA